MNLRKVIFIGPVPPPHMGPSMATEIILNSRMKSLFDLIHMDTSDHRALNKLGALDFWNVYLGMKHYFHLFRLLKKENPDLVYIPISQTTIGYIRDSGFILLTKLFRKKVLCHLRGGNFKNWLDKSSLFTRWFVKKVHSRVDGQIVLGKKLTHLFENLVNSEKIFVVPNGNDYPTGTKEQGRRKIQILFLANFMKTKGVIDTLHALSFIFLKQNQIEMRFIGNWIEKETRDEFIDFTNRYPELPITFLGPATGIKKMKMLEETDIFVFPTYYPPEGHPWVIVEAMSAGLPIISTDQGAITESVIDGVNGFIVEKRNPGQIAEKIEYLIEHPEVRKKMGRESRRLYLENFTEEKMVERLADAFNKVLEN